MTSVAYRRKTVEDLYALPDDGLRYELVHGEFVSEPPPGRDSQSGCDDPADELRPRPSGCRNYAPEKSTPENSIEGASVVP